jgi:hypothetical protein
MQRKARARAFPLGAHDGAAMAAGVEETMDVAAHVAVENHGTSGDARVTKSLGFFSSEE